MTEPAATRSLLRGGLLLTLAQAVANGGNYVLNLALGRWMTPADFADANLMVSLMLLVAGVALGVQLVTARVVATASDDRHRQGSLQRIRRFGLGLGIGFGVLLGAGASWWQQLLNTGSPWVFVLLGASLPAFLALAWLRGVMQGHTRFGALAGTYLVEVVVRVAVAAGFVAGGYGALGATAGLSLSLLATWAMGRLALGRLGAAAGGSVASGDGAAAGDRVPVRQYAVQMSVLLIGQAVANNGDVLIAKHALPPQQAARYAAVSLVGRAVFFLTWAVAVTFFPVVARRHADGLPTGDLLRRGAAAVLGIGLACTVGAAVVGGPVLGLVLGPGYSGLSRPLAGYALATTVLAVCNFVASYGLSVDRVEYAVLLLIGAFGQLGVLSVQHSSIPALVWGQLAAMGVLLVAMVLALIRNSEWRSVRRSPYLVEVTSR